MPVAFNPRQFRRCDTLAQSGIFLYAKIHSRETPTYLLASDQKVTKETLAKWLDGNIVHKDVPQPESYAFFLGMVERLLEKRRWTLGELWREKYRLKEAV